MILDEQDLRNGLSFIVGTWQPEFVVNAFSNDLAHIPASDFKTDDGRDFTALSFTFFEDHSVAVTDTSASFHEKGTWEQTDWGTYRYSLGAFGQMPEGPLRDAAETLSVQDGRLVFGIGFLAVAMQKTAEGVVTETVDDKDREMTEEDKTRKEIVGRYAVVKTMAMVNDDFGLHTREEVTAELEKKRASGEIDEDMARETLGSFDTVIEFTDDHRVVTWMKIPAGCDEETIREAIASGEISEVRDGFFPAEETEWKSINGKYYYNTRQSRELFGEKLSPWDEIVSDDDGLIDYMGGMMMLRRQ